MQFDFHSLCRSDYWKKVGVITGILFWVTSCFVPESGVLATIASLVLGVMGCTSVILITRNISLNKWLEKIMNVLARYTLPVYLMHTIFAAGIRAVMLKLGVHNSSVHVVIGLTASFAGPVIAAEIMTRLKCDFLLYPSKYLSKK